ncbi:MAG: YjbQ family protein [Nitrospira sp.]|nr:YjbQ family protein [Nitrospira sp.]
MTETFRIKTRQKKDIFDLTERLSDAIEQAGVNDGLCTVFVSHTTAAITTGEIGEGTEQDLLDVVEAMIPMIRFRHAHNPSHAWSHMASSILGPSLTIPISEGRLLLGTWQSVLLVELDGPRERTVHVTMLSNGSL